MGGRQHSDEEALRGLCAREEGRAQVHGHGHGSKLQTGGGGVGGLEALEGLLLLSVLWL